MRMDMRILEQASAYWRAAPAARPIPWQDEYPLHRMAADALRLFVASPEPLTDERFQLLLRLHGLGGATQDGLRQRYLAGGAFPQRVRERLWQAGVDFHRQLAEVYTAFARHYSGHRPGRAGAAGAELARAVGGALLSAKLESRWGYFRGVPMPPWRWRRLHRLYRLAEKRGFAEEYVIIGDNSATTCVDEYLQILALDVLTPSALPPAQTELLGLWLAHHCVGGRLCRVRPAGAAFPVHSGRSVDDGSVAGGKSRYWLPGLLLNALKVSAGEIHALGEDAQGVFAMAHRVWSQARAIDGGAGPGEGGGRGPASEVNTLTTPATAVERPEFTPSTVPRPSCARYSPSEPASLPADRPQAGKDPGNGLTAAGAKIVEMDREAAALRWMREFQPGQAVVSIERLSHVPRPVWLSGEAGRLPAAAQKVPALFLPQVDRQGMASSLVLPTRAYGCAGIYRLVDGPAVYRVRLTTLVESRPAWVRARFIVLGRSVPLSGDDVGDVKGVTAVAAVGEKLPECFPHG